MSWNFPSDSGLQSIISMKFPDLKERYLEKKEEMMAHLTRETGVLNSPDAAVQKRAGLGHLLYALLAWSGFLGIRSYEWKPHQSERYLEVRTSLSE